MDADRERITTTVAMLRRLYQVRQRLGLPPHDGGRDGSVFPVARCRRGGAAVLVLPLAGTAWPSPAGFLGGSRGYPPLADDLVHALPADTCHFCQVRR